MIKLVYTLALQVTRNVDTNISVAYVELKEEVYKLANSRTSTKQ